MKTRALQKNIHIAARKANLVCALIRHKKVNEALVILDHTEKKVARIMKKILNSAIANATNNHNMSGEKLYVYQAIANQGTTIKRSLPRAKGSAHMLRKRHTHITIVLSDDLQQGLKDRMKTPATNPNKKPHKTTSKVVTRAQSANPSVKHHKPVIKLDETPVAVTKDNKAKEHK
jgi:ribosomal protein L22